MQLNIPFSVRNFDSFSQGNSRTVLAWVLSDYVSEVLDLSSPDVFRVCVRVNIEFVNSKLTQ